MNSHEAIGISLLGADLIGKSAPARIDVGSGFSRTTLYFDARPIFMRVEPS